MRESNGVIFVRLDRKRRMIDVGLIDGDEEFGGWLTASQARSMAAELLRVAAELEALGTANGPHHSHKRPPEVKNN